MFAINYLAVAVAAVVIFLIGGLWYSPPVFWRKWVALSGRTEDEMRAAAKAANMPMNFLQVFLCGLVTSAALALVLAHMPERVHGAGAGVAIGTLCWLFVAAATYGSALFAFKPRALWAIDAGFSLVSMLAAGAILGAWR